MQRVRLLISRGIEALRGKSFPRLVTAPNGRPRWEAYSGRTFASREEAY
jgi:hypothetical protein